LVSMLRPVEKKKDACAAIHGGEVTQIARDAEACDSEALQSASMSWAKTTMGLLLWGFASRWTPGGLPRLGSL